MKTHRPPATSRPCSVERAPARRAATCQALPRAQYARLLLEPARRRFGAREHGGNTSPGTRVHARGHSFSADSFDLRDFVVAVTRAYPRVPLQTSTVRRGSTVGVRQRA